MSKNTIPGPGWYRDPSMPGTQRYWDGQAWTDHRAPMAPRKPDTGGLLAGGIITAILLPIVGFIIGIVLIAKSDGRGVGVMILAVVAFMFWLNALTPDAPTYSYNNGY